MRTLVLLLALPAAALAAREAPREAARCNPGADRARLVPKTPPRARPLNEMPDARSVLTVYRQVDGCNVLLVREGGRIIEEPTGRPERRRVFTP